MKPNNMSWSMCGIPQEPVVCLMYKVGIGLTGRRVPQQLQASAFTLHLFSVIREYKVPRRRGRHTNHDLLALLLTPHAPDRLCRRPDEFESGVLHAGGKDRGLGQEPIARVNSLY